MISWALGFDLHVSVLDLNFYESIKRIRQQIAAWYPSFGIEGRMYVDEVVDTNTSEKANSLLFYSGGVDSLASYIRHRDEDPLLVPVHGADIKLVNLEGWDNIYSKLHDFATNETRDISLIRSNFRDVINDYRLNPWIDDQLVGGWWAGIQHGLGIISLCAPLTYSRGIDTVYFAASYTDEFSHPWGSHPAIDNNIQWGATQTIHDGYEMSRQDKINLISDQESTLKSERVVIRSCFNTSTGGNCNRCEKCVRTMVGLLLAGSNPNDNGFVFDKERATYIKNQLSQGNWLFEEDEEFMWTDIQNHIPDDFESDIAGGTALIDWVSQQDVERLRDISDPHNKPYRARVAPYLHRMMPSKWYQSLQNLNRRLPF